jgi:hypothetical protein
VIANVPASPPIAVIGTTCRRHERVTERQLAAGLAAHGASPAVVIGRAEPWRCWSCSASVFRASGGSSSRARAPPAETASRRHPGAGRVLTPAEALATSPVARVIDVSAPSVARPERHARSAIGDFHPFIPEELPWNTRRACAAARTAEFVQLEIEVRQAGARRDHGIASARRASRNVYSGVTVP